MVLFLYFWYNSDSSLQRFHTSCHSCRCSTRTFSWSTFIHLQTAAIELQAVLFFYTLEKEIRRWTTKLGAQVHVRPLKVLIYIRNYDVIMLPISHIQEPTLNHFLAFIHKVFFNLGKITYYSYQQNFHPSIFLHLFLVSSRSQGCISARGTRKP